jgi:Asp-tRNA(Asn)/Glu-tRNA(Gln) amidotransferase A subunit family amidase
VRSPVWHLAEAPQRELFEANQVALRKAGAKVEPVDLPPDFDKAIEVTRVIHFSEIAYHYRELMAQRAGEVSTRFREFYEGGLRYSAAEYLEALDKRDKLRAILAEFFASYDAIITPPATGEPPRTLTFTGDANFCTIWTLCGVPCVSFPTAKGPQGMPMGLQVVGAYLNDGLALGAAKWCMEQLPFRIGVLD